MPDPEPLTSRRAPALSLRGVSISYDDALIIDHVSFDIASGESVALVGANGSGKSTLVRGIVGLLPLATGEVLVHGQPRDPRRPGTRIGYVPQHHTLATSVSATVTEIVATARLVTRPWWKPTSRTDRDVVARAIAAVGMGDRAHDDVSALSGGQHRRVLIARALASEPDLLVMDEPTAGVDVASQGVLAEVLTALRGQGLTMLTITHELDHLESALSRVIHLDHGRIDFDGTLDELADNPIGLSLGHCHDEPTLAPITQPLPGVLA